MQIGKKLKYLRGKWGVLRQEIANQMSVSIWKIGQIENGYDCEADARFFHFFRDEYGINSDHWFYSQEMFERIYY